MYQDKAMLLVEALRSGEYPQSRCALCFVEQYDDDRPAGFCCLGVACEVAIKNGVPVEVTVSGATKSYDHQSGYMPHRVVDFFGFQDDHGGTRDRQRVLGEHSSLAEANDHRVSFADIANYIEANYANL